MQLSTPVPANAESKCSIVEILYSPYTSVVERVVSPTFLAVAGISTTLSPSILLKSIPVFGSAG